MNTDSSQPDELTIGEMRARAGARPEIEVDDEMVCEKCGGEMAERLVGDEVYDRCVDCGSINF